MLAFSDSSDADLSAYNYKVAANQIGAFQGDSYSTTGGDNWSLSYTGHMTQLFSSPRQCAASTIAAASVRSALDEQCSSAA